MTTKEPAHATARKKKGKKRRSAESAAARREEPVVDETSGREDPSEPVRASPTDEDLTREGRGAASVAEPEPDATSEADAVHTNDDVEAPRIGAKLGPGPLSDALALLGTTLEILRPFAPFLIPAALLLIVLVVGLTFGPPSAILVLCAATLLSVIAVLWASVRTVVGEAPLHAPDAFALAAPRAEEELKQSALRALKDLEFERSVGKISERDYRELSARYRDDAKRLLRQLDELRGARANQAEALVRERLARAGFDLPTEPVKDESEDAESQAEDAESQAEDAMSPARTSAVSAHSDDDDKAEDTDDDDSDDSDAGDARSVAKRGAR